MMNCWRAGGSLKAAVSLPRPLQSDSFFSIHHSSFIVHYLNNMTNQSAPRVAVIGAGYWGINHVRNFYELDALGLVCDTSAPSLARIKEKFPRVRVESDLNVALNDPSIDGVVIATPAETHYELARRSIEAGKDVLVEKPLTLDVGEGQRLVERAG